MQLAERSVMYVEAADLLCIGRVHVVARNAPDPEILAQDKPVVAAHLTVRTLTQLAERSVKSVEAAAPDLLRSAPQPYPNPTPTLP